MQSIVHDRLNWPTYNVQLAPSQTSSVRCFLCFYFFFSHFYSINGFYSLSHNIWFALLSKGHIVNSRTLIFSLISHRTIMMQGSLLKAPVLSSNNGLHFHPGYTPRGVPSLQVFDLRVSSCHCCPWMYTAVFWTQAVNMWSLTGRVCFWKWSNDKVVLSFEVSMCIMKQQNIHWLCVWIIVFLNKLYNKLIMRKMKDGWMDGIQTLYSYSIIQLLKNVPMSYQVTYFFQHPSIPEAIL